ncbi:hypothetical protein Tco_0451308 [Tanacetum coccineum]
MEPSTSKHADTSRIKIKEEPIEDPFERKEKVVDVEDESETNERSFQNKVNRVLKGRATVRPLFEAMRGLTPQRKRVELYELLEKSIESILIDKAEIEEKINEILIKFQNDERLIQLRDKMKVIFKEPNIPEYHSSSSTESDDDDDDNSQVGDDNEKSYGTQTDSVEEDQVQIVTTTQQEERNKLQYNDEENDEKEERKANKKATNQKIYEEIDPFDDPTFGEYYLQNEHLFVPTQTSAEKKYQTDDINWDSFLENEEQFIRKGREFYAEIRKNAQQQERERKRKGKREKDQIGSSSQESPVFGIVNSLQERPRLDTNLSIGYADTLKRDKHLSDETDRNWQLACRSEDSTGLGDLREGPKHRNTKGKACAMRASRQYCGLESLSQAFGMLRSVETSNLAEESYHHKKALVADLSDSPVYTLSHAPSPSPPSTTTPTPPPPPSSPVTNTTTTLHHLMSTTNG